MRTVPLFRHRLRRRPFPQAMRVFYVLLGEDRPSDVRARRGSFRCWALTLPSHCAAGLHIPKTPLRRRGLAPLPWSETEWGRLGGGRSQQRHPERSDGETRGLNQEPVEQAPNQQLIVRHHSGLCPPGGGPPERSEGEEGELRCWDPRPPSVTGYAGATFPPAQGRRLGHSAAKTSGSCSSPIE